MSLPVATATATADATADAVDTAASAADAPPPAGRVAIQADLLDFTADPGLSDTASPAVRWRPAHWLLIGDDGRIADITPHAPGDDWPRQVHAGRLLMPGFIDAHVHAPQLDVIGSWGTELLDWLNTYTFPAEARHADPAVAAEVAATFLDALRAHGTTAAAVYATVHAASAEALFAAARRRGMRLITGKVLMDRHAPDNLRDDDLARSEADCQALIARWHGRDRLAYAVTPRFAPTSTPAQLQMAGRLMRQHGDLYMQTHVAENRDEVAWAGQLFPQSRSYLAVYDDFGLLSPRAVLGHGIWLDDADRSLLQATGAQIAFCPSSNLFLGSGLFDWAAAAQSGVPVSLASDVGGGTTLSMVRTMVDAYKVQALAGRRITAWALLHAATRGAAQALQLGHEIGRLEPGLMADLCLWDWAQGPVAQRRDALARGLHERCFAWLVLADDRNLHTSWVAGRPLRHQPDQRAD